MQICIPSGKENVCIGALCHLKRKQLNLFLHLMQGIGAIFLTVFSAAYILALHSYDFRGFGGVPVLSGEPVFHLLLSIFGGLLVLFTVIAIVLSVTVKPED
jgi:hypothetical protein